MSAKVAVFGILRFPAENVASVLPYLEEFVRKTQEQDLSLIHI